MSTDKHFPDDVFFGAGGDTVLPDIEQGSTATLSASLWGDSPEGADPEFPSDADVFQDEYGGIGDLGEVMTAGVQNLDWLEVVEQDVERLPKNVSTGTVIPELEEAWGTGIEVSARHHALDREQLAYQASLEKEPEQKRLAKADVQRIIQKALRRSAAGYPLKAIIAEAKKAVGPEVPRIRAALSWIVSEHGLAGRVFIRADAYPGCNTGKWKKEIPKIASGSKYLVAKDRCKGCIHNRQGSCAVFAKRLVAEVPWEEARELYAPILAATGRPVADGDPRKTLKAAFQAPATSPKSDRTDHLPVHTAPSQRVTADQAKEAFANAPKQERQVFDDQVLVIQAKLRMAQLKIAGWVKAELLPKEIGTSLVKSGMAPHEMLRQAALAVTRSGKTADFSGLENDTRVVPATAEVAQAEMARAAAAPKPEPVSIAHREPAGRRAAAQQQLVAWLKKGWLTKEACTRLVKSDADPRMVLKAAATMITSATGVSPYTGQPNEAKVRLATDEQVWEALRKAEVAAKQVQVQVDAVVQKREVAATRDHRLDQALQAKVAHVQRAIGRGIKGQALRNLIIRTIPRDKVAEVMPILDPILKASGALEDTVPTSQTYKGAKFKAAQKQAVKKAASPTEVRDCVQFTRRQLHYGIHGQTLNRKLRGRFASHVLAAALPELKELRAALEPEAAKRQGVKVAEMQITLDAPSYDPHEYQLGREGDLSNIHMDEKEKFEALNEITFGGMEF